MLRPPRPSGHRTVDAALRVARSGRIEAERLDLRDLLAGAVRSTQPRFAERDATLLTPDPPAEPIPVVGDANALETLFVNLLRNAAQGIGPRGTAELTVRSNGRRVEVQRRDDGHGMTPEQLARAFHPFATTRPVGTGLGLPIARQIAYADGGEIEVESETGVETTVRVRLGTVRHGSG